MASYLAFISTYPYQRGPSNPTNAGRGVGRGRLYIGHGILYRTSRKLFRTAIEEFFRPICEISRIENSKSANLAREDLERLRKLMASFALPAARRRPGPRRPQVPGTAPAESGTSSCPTCPSPTYTLHRSSISPSSIGPQAVQRRVATLWRSWRR